jgi:hypothetical protein
VPHPYPRPDTTAAVSLDFIRANPGCSQRAVVLHNGRNHVVVVRALAMLERHGLIEVAVNEYGHKSISAVGNEP